MSSSGPSARAIRAEQDQPVEEAQIKVVDVTDAVTRGIIANSSRGTPLPEQMVDSDGQITIPFVGRVQAAGRTPSEIARTITSRLAGKAHQPQAIVRLSRNAAANVTVVGEVANSARVPLTSRGERVLDVLATVGGVRQPVGKMTVQITRGMKVSALPLEPVIPARMSGLNPTMS